MTHVIPVVECIIVSALLSSQVISSTDENVVERVKEITGGRMAYGAVDSVSGDLLGSVVASVRNGGSVLIFGAASGLNFQASAADFIFR